MEGGDLGKTIRKDKAVPRQTSWYQQGRYIALGIARGLAYLHKRGIVWFDCKPGNVLLNGSGDVAKIADFGLARILETTVIMTHQVRRVKIHSEVYHFLQDNPQSLYSTHRILSSAVEFVFASRFVMLSIVMIRSGEICRGGLLATSHQS